MGRRRDRRHGTLGGGVRRVKLDLSRDEDLASDSFETGANDQNGGDESQLNSAGVSSPQLLQVWPYRATFTEPERVENAAGSNCHLGAGAGASSENPLSLLGQYSDEDEEEECDISVPRLENGTRRHIALPPRPVDEQVANFMADLQTSGLLEHELGSAIRADVAVGKAHTTEVNWQVGGVEDLAVANPVEDKKERKDDRLWRHQSSNGLSRPNGNGGMPENHIYDGTVAWKVVLDPESRDYYYWNTITGETTWEKPAVTNLRENLSGLNYRSASQEEHMLDQHMEDVAAADIQIDGTTTELCIAETVEDVGQESMPLVELESEPTGMPAQELESEGPSISGQGDAQPAVPVPQELGWENGSVDDTFASKLNGPSAEQAITTSPAVFKSACLEDTSLLQDVGRKGVMLDEEQCNNPETSSGVAALIGNAGGHQEQLKQFLDWGESVACRLEVLAGDGLQALPLCVRVAIEARIRVSDCQNLASEGGLDETFRSYSEEHLKRLESAIPVEEAAASAEAEQNAVDRILERSFQSLHAGSINEAPQAGRTGFRALRPPVSAQHSDTGDEGEDREPHEHQVESDAGAPTESVRPGMDEAVEDEGLINQENSFDSAEPSQVDAGNVVQPLTLEQHAEPSVACLIEPQDGPVDLGNAGPLNVSNEVDMEVDMDVDDGAFDEEPAVASVSASTGDYCVHSIVNYGDPSHAGSAGPGLLPQYPLPFPMSMYPMPLTTDVWQQQPPPPPLPDDDWVPPPPPDPEIAPPPPPDEPPPPPPPEFTCDVSASTALAPHYIPGTSYSYFSAPSMYYYVQSLNGYRMVNGTVNGVSSGTENTVLNGTVNGVAHGWTGAVVNGRSEPKAGQADEASSKLSTCAKEAAPLVATESASTSAVSKKPSKVSRSKKRPHSTAVAPTLMSNKKVSNLVNKWIAAKEELQESDEEDNDKYDIDAMEKKRQKEIEEWRREQLASGGALDNANFQPLGIADWRERVKRAKKTETKSSAGETAGSKAEKPDLKELEKGLPSGWQAFWDSSSGEVYYGNLSTSETSWDRPQ